MRTRRPLLRLAQFAVVAALLAVVLALVAQRPDARTPGATAHASVAAAAARPSLPDPGSALPPGVVTVARAATPGGPVPIRVYRGRSSGGLALCVDQLPQGNGQCITYPVGPNSRYAHATRDLWLIDGGYGSCHVPRFQVITAIVLARGLTAWLRVPGGGTERMPAVAVPRVFGVSGPLVYATLARGGDTIVLRDRLGATAFSTPAPTPGPAGYCGGLNPDTSR
jgi:hypothetical protein